MGKKFFASLHRIRCFQSQACRGIWTNLLEIRDEMNSGLTREGHHLVSGGCDNVCRELEARQRAREDMLVQQTTPVLETLLEAFKVRES